MLTLFSNAVVNTAAVRVSYEGLAGSIKACPGRIFEINRIDTPSAQQMRQIFDKWLFRRVFMQR
jgi:hypothetical protein